MRWFLLIVMTGCTAGRTSGPDAATEDVRCTFDVFPLGAPCICNDQCGTDALYCLPSAAEPDGPSYCTRDCIDASECPAGYGCFEGTCQFCSIEPGMVPLMGACFCDSDCAPDPGGAGIECTDGVCSRAGCVIGDPATCPEGYGCETGVGTSTYCTQCVAPPTGALGEGGACGCSAECMAGLVCREGACRRPCATDAECGGASCIHRTLVTPSCQPPITGCAGDGSRTPGQSCSCNADCMASAPFCLLGSIGDVAIDRCAVACTPGGGSCPLGTRCCEGSTTLSPTCLPEEVIITLSDLACDL